MIGSKGHFGYAACKARGPGIYIKMGWLQKINRINLFGELNLPLWLHDEVTGADFFKELY